MVGREDGPWDLGYRAGFNGSGYSSGLDWHASGQDYLDWFAGWKAGRQAAISEAVRVGVRREWSRNYLNMGRSA